MFAIRRGTVYLHSKCDRQVHILQLNNVLHVSSNKNNLLALGHWEDKAGCKVIFDYGKVILSMKDGTVIAKGMKIRSKLYHITLTLISNPEANVVCMSINISSIPWETWHWWFGHVGYLGLQNLLCLNLVDGFQVDASSPKPNYIACTKVKLFEAPFGPTSKRQTKIGELTHTDLWGKYDIKSINGNQYYLLLINNAI